MVTGLREFLETKAGKGIAAVLILIAAIAIFMSIRSNLGQTEAAALSRERVYICSETGKTFEVDLKPGMSVPVLSPYSDKETGYPPELCFWTADGKPKTDPTYVLLNRYKNVTGPTFCPDCNRLVVRDNPPPGPESTPPPTESEYKSRGGSKATDEPADQ